mmetsp:Transcript_88163/g.267366  ORF Transcript_88163/g.267366 Transcript_88163/m.267366 type:complete len:253 (-) Transcript_88163:49-807(-)
MAPQPIRAVAALAALASTEALLASRGQDACACLNWQQVYRSKQAECGKALEFYLVTKRGVPGTKAKAAVGDEFCGKFFQHVNDNFCLNADFTHKPDHWSGKQWCYVAPQCQQLRGGRKVPGSQLSWKICSEQDRQTRTMSPLQLDGIRGSQSLDLGLLAKFSYPIWQKDRWPALERHFMRPGPLSGLRTDLQEVVDAGEPMLLDSKDGHPPFHVVVGQQIYRIDYKPGGKKAYFLGRMGEVNEIKCVKGCDQ